MLVGAGDIAVCDWPGDEKTARLLDGIPGTVFTTGDNAYPDGSAEDFSDCYHPSWGRHRERTRPAPGNHEYYTDDGAGYFGYFGDAAGPARKGWYSYAHGDWHVVVLNSECHAVDGCEAGSEQERWLRAELAANPARCTLAVWHSPLFSSGKHGGDTDVEPFWRALYDDGAEVVLNGHDHHYERFALQTPDGERDDGRGIRQFVVGTGGGYLYDVGSLEENSQFGVDDTFGVLRLRLWPDRYEWAFLRVDGGEALDSGEAVCH